MNQYIISQNLRLLRAAARFTQAKIAARSQISLAAYRKIEAGLVIPKVTTLYKIAKALDVTLQDLLEEPKILQGVRFRALKRMNTRETIIHDVARWLEDYNALESTVNDKAIYIFDNLKQQVKARTAKDSLARNTASEARKRLEICEDEPVRDICGLLESAGIKIYPMKLASYEFFGLSVAPDGGGPAIVVNVWDRIPVERWIFSAAHELGHLLLHLGAYDVNQTLEDKTQETEANMFASFFLMPQEAFEKEWAETYGWSFVDRVLKVKRMFKVSYKTVLYRLQASADGGENVWAKFAYEYKKNYRPVLSPKDEPKALMKNAFLASMPESSRAQEPYNLTDKDFMEDRLIKLVRIAFEQGKISLTRGADVLRIDLHKMRDIAASWSK